MAVVCLGRCRQAQLLSQGRALSFRMEMVRALLISFIVEQRWGFRPGAVDDEGDLQAEGALNSDPMDCAPTTPIGWKSESRPGSVLTSGDAEFYMQRIE